MRTENDGNVIIGSGEGGKVLAWQNAGQVLSNEDPDVAAERNWCGDGR